MGIYSKATYFGDVLGYALTAAGLGMAVETYQRQPEEMYAGLITAAIGIGAAVMSRRNRALIQDISKQTEEIVALGQRAARQTEELADLIQEHLSRNA